MSNGSILGRARGSDRDRQRVGATHGCQEIASREGDSSGRRKGSPPASIVRNLDGATPGGAPAYGCASIEETGELSGQDSRREDATGEDPGHDSQEIRQLLPTVASVASRGQSRQHARHGSRPH